MTDRPIRTLVVDDSVFMRAMLKKALSRAANIEVIGSAQNGTEALKKIGDLKPDVVTLDIEMPGLSGLDVLERVMKDAPIPIVMVSTKTQEGAEMTFQALELGAVDYVAKPLADKSASLQRFQEKVVHAVETAFKANRHRLGGMGKRKILRPRAATIDTADRVVAIGISAGGPATLHELLPMFPKDFPPVVLAQHMPAGFTAPFAERLNRTAAIEIKEAASRDVLEPGRLYLAPGDRHLRIVKQGATMRLMLDKGAKMSGFRPSVDVLFHSVAATFGDRAIGLVMTGMGSDGAQGIRDLRAAGAKTLAQDCESSIVFGMPKAAADTGCVDQVVALAEIPDILVRLLRSPAASTAP